MKTVTELMTLLSSLPPKAIDRLFSIAQNLQDDQPAHRMPCPYCGEVHIDTETRNIFVNMISGSISSINESELISSKKANT